MLIQVNILVTNDDGIHASGLSSLVNCMKEYGNVTVVAPCSPMSGVGHAITMRNPVFIEETDIFSPVKAYCCTGTPADCVKFANGNLFPSPPDLIVSGINHGSNASVNMLYSGTVAAAVEGALYGIPSMAFSSLNYHEDADMSLCEKVVHEIMQTIDIELLKQFFLLNINIPDIDISAFKGLKICRQSMAHWKETFRQNTADNGKNSFWLTGEFICSDKEPDTDIWALENNFASVVPVYLDLTAYPLLNHLQKIFANEKV
ncbi:MAG: 5'/3'-nucleotidase SurE [Sphingobacteriales bacterium]|nr:5'/3'-nucleotidase SurE [Sphingobacteriales bacterium]